MSVQSPRVSERTWAAMLTEVARQSVLQKKKREHEERTEWVQVEANEEELGSELWPSQQWHIALDMLFVQLPPRIEALRAEQDDLLLFVPFPPSTATWLRPPPPRPPLHIRRRSAQLPPELAMGAPAAERLDWQATVSLNLAMQTRYWLTIVVCEASETAGVAGRCLERIALERENAERRTAEQRSNEAAASTAQSHPLDSVAYCGQVWPSTSATPVAASAPGGKQGGRAAAQPRESYPDLSFAVHGRAPESIPQLLESGEDCYCVMLHADVCDWRAAQRLGSAREEEARRNATEEAAASATSSYRPVSDLRTVFSGFVSRQALAQSVTVADARRGGSMHVVMTGPGGVGAAQVAMTFRAGLGETTSPAGKLSGLPSLIKGATSAVAKMAREVLRDPREEAALECALLSLSVPADALAGAILDELAVEDGGGPSLVHRRRVR